jgi:hypothetical protein
MISPYGDTISDPELAISITIGTYFLAVTLPKIAPHLKMTNGLMGFFNGNTKEYGKVFRNQDGTSIRNPNQIINWAMTHAVVNPIFLNQSTRLFSISNNNIPPLSIPIVHPGRLPKITREKLSFCKKMLLRLYRNQSLKEQQRFKTQMKSCLQDADSPSVARSIGKVIKVSRVQQKASVKALVKVVKKKIENEKIKEKLRINDNSDDDNEE